MPATTGPGTANRCWTSSSPTSCWRPRLLLDFTRTQTARRQVLERGLHLVNALFLHRQLLDDLLDLESDSCAGILGGPAYLLLALNRPAAADSSGESRLSDLVQVLRGRMAAAGPGALEEERETARAFGQAWPAHGSAAAALLKGSRTVQALLGHLTDPARTAPIHRQLQELLLQEPGAAPAISYFHHRSARTCRKLLESLAPPGSAPGPGSVPGHSLEASLKGDHRGGAPHPARIVPEDFGPDELIPICIQMAAQAFQPMQAQAKHS